MTFYIETMGGSCIVSYLLSIIEMFKDVIVNDLGLFFNCIMVPVRVTSGWLSVMYSRYQGTCTLQSFVAGPNKLLFTILIQERPHASNIVFSECQAAVGLRFLGRQLSAKTSLLLVTGLEHSGAGGTLAQAGSFGFSETRGKSIEPLNRSPARWQAFRV